MSDNLIFDGVLNIDISEGVKKIEGSLPKIGRAAQVEMLGQINSGVQNTMKSMSKQWGSIASEYIQGAFNPLLTHQEQRAMLAPKLAGAAALANPLGIGLQKIAPALANGLRTAIESATRGGYMKANYVYSGAKETVASYAGQMAQLGMAPDDETIRYMLKTQKTRREMDFTAREKVTELADKEFSGEFEKELLNVHENTKKQVDELIENFKKLNPSLANITAAFEKSSKAIENGTVKMLRGLRKLFGISRTE
jgi:hypothetical protein